jgi:hypothetical protein
MHSNNPLAPLAGNAPPFNINIKCNCQDGMTKKATETIVPNLVHNSTRLPAVLPNPMVEYDFPVLEADEEADGPKDIVATLPNKMRLTPLSIMVCDTISAVQSRTLLKVLFDPGSTTTFISRKCLPRHCKPCPVARTRSVNTLAESCTANHMVVLRAIRLPELDKNRVVDQHKALVFDGDIRYDLILGANFLTKTGIDIRYSS